MTKTKRQLRAEAVERLKNDAGARFSPDAIVCALLDGRRGKIDWSLECDAILDLLTDDDGAARSNDGATNLERLFIESEQFRQAASAYAFAYADDCPTSPTKMVDWLMAPHEDANDVFSGESVVTPEAVDANDGNATQDSREKLEADVRDWMHEHIIQPHDSVSKVLEWLDRQARITHSIDAWNIERLEKRIADQRDQVDYLTEKLEAAYAKNRALKAHISKMQEGRHGWHIKAAKLQAQVDKLTAECGECVYKQEFASIDELQMKVDALTQANADYREEWHRVCRERDELRRELTKSNRERERLRKQLGIAIDHAHDMIALVSLDGDAE